MKRPNKEQLRALLRVYNRGAMGGPGSEPMTYRQFRRTAQYVHHMGVLMVPWCGMWLGIEKDGYTHS
jgi:hypothetical protein